MKYAIISDIHGNVEALESVLEEIDRIQTDAVICLGDVVGYGPNPNECVEIIKERAEITLAGNHDYAPIGKLDLSYFNTWAKNAIEWTSEQLTKSSTDFLKGLPLKTDRYGFTIVHSTPDHPDDWNYIITTADAVKNFPEFSTQICFVGHSHVPMIVSLSKGGEYKSMRNNPLEIDSSLRYIINVGSVGQPRDLIPKAAFAVYDTSAGVYESVRVEYNVAETQRKILQCGLPPFLAERLEIGQ